MHQEATQCQIYVRMCIFKLQVLIDNYLPLCLMACPIALNLALKAMRNHLLRQRGTTVPARICMKNITHMHSTYVVRREFMRSTLVLQMKGRENSSVLL